MIQRPLRASLSLVLCVSLLPFAPSLAQDTAPSTFTSNSELVMVPVQVLDHAGHPVRGLKAQNFVLKSDGNPQHIAVFDEMQTAPAPPIIVTPAAAKAPASPGVLAASPTAFTNQPAEGIPQQLLILAIDTVNTPASLQSWSRDQLIRYLQANPPRLPVEVVAITPNGLRQVHSSTTDTAALIAAIKTVHGRLTRNDVKTPLLSRMDRNGGIDTYTSMVDQLQERATEQANANFDAGATTLRNFEEMAWAYSGIPGRKTVLWLTTGFPIQQMVPDGPGMIGHGNGRAGTVPYSSGMRVSNELLPAFQRALTSLNKANVTIYPVDVQGLPMDDMWDPSMPSSLYIHPELSHLGPSLVPNQAGEARDGMRELAHRTGGKICTAGKDVTGCLQQAVSESSDFYLLGFYVSQQQRKTGWHKLKVSVNADHGEVRARNSYYLHPPGPAPEWEQEADLRSAIDSAVDYTGILFTVLPGPRTAGSTAPVSFKVSVPASSILLLPGSEKLSFDVITIPLSVRGTPVSKQARIVKLDMDPQVAQKALLKGWNLINTVPDDKSITAVKVVIRDNASGRIGSVTFPVDSAGSKAAAGTHAGAPS